MLCAAPRPDAAFDHALLMNALTYATDAARVLSEAARVLRPGGKLVLTTLRAHPHLDSVASYDHVNAGFEPEQLEGLLEAAGFQVSLCTSTHEEPRAPHFSIITVHAKKRDNP